jgi:hypothetical protein
MMRYMARGKWFGIGALVLGMALAAAPSARAGAQYSSTILADGPIGYWRLGEPQTAPSAVEATGSGRNGNYTRSVVSGVQGAIAGDPDTAATFDGLSTAVVIPAVANDPYNMQNGFSLEAWVINQGQGTVNPPSSPLGRIVSRGWPGRFGYGWGILANNGMRFTTFGIKDFDSNITVVPQDNAWHYVVMVFDSTDTANFYLDGQLMDTVGSTGPANPSPTDLHIGKNPVADGSLFYEYWNGSIDEVAVYNYELSAQQVTAHYQAAQ